MAEPILETELAAYLNAQGFGNLATGAVYPKVIYTGFVPAVETGQLIVVQEGPGGPAPQYVSQERGVTITAVDPDPIVARTVLQQIQRLLEENQGILEPAIMVARITADSNPVPLGRDANERHAFSISFTFLTKTFVAS